ncbi:MAG: serine/threonine protein kinase, partial [Pirellulaceae bacterium]|nr:serine/threonine protein kinase [Pirellulaceae bacterium]
HHPHIARFLETGIHDHRPYFAMEYIPGPPITDYCDRHKLTIKQRLQLFQQVCHAVQHAHLKAIIHRDISARNVLVTEVDGQPTAKVIDFGIAKALSLKLTDLTLDTAPGHTIGNYAYMSPEQADPAADVDTRTDVYSLGVLLYELLAGERPFDNATLARAGDDGIKKLIRESDPPTPSTKLSTHASATEIAAKRQQRLDQLIGTLRGELEWIPLMALRKERERRYQTPSDLADDISAYLNGRPVAAAPESRVYRVRKWLKRNALPASAAAAVLILLTAGLAGTTYGLRRAQYHAIRADAEANEKGKQKAEAELQRDEARRQKTEAEKQAAIAEAVAKFLTDTLATADPDNLLGDKVTVVQAMTAAVQELDAGKFKDQPLIEAAVRDTIGSTLGSLAQFDKAEPNLRRALDIRRRVLPLGHPNIADSLNNLASLLQEQDRLAEAEPFFREALDIYRKALPSGHPDIALGLNNVASLLQEQNKLAEAEPLLREALGINRKALPVGHPMIATSLNNLAALLRAQNNLAGAELLYREALDIFRTAFPPGHPDIALGLNNLASLLYT